MLHPDTQAILLLCGSLGRPRASEAPLTLSEYNQVAQWLQQQQLRPADLLAPAGLLQVQTADPPLPLGERIASLIARGTALALAVEHWTNQGLWVVGRSDPSYPQLLRARLGRQAPPILYGVGEHSLLEYGGLAVVGARDADEAALTFTRTVAHACALQGVAVVSGGARGVDSAAMQAALDGAGNVLGVLADSLARTAVAGKYRAALRTGRLVLVSPYDPEAGFNTGNAMNRNKAIYALSDFALVVCSNLEQGGTWHGAIENLRRAWVPLFVRTAVPQSPGNQRLIELGGLTLDQAALSHAVSLDAWLAGRELATATPLAFDAPPLEAAPRPLDAPSEPVTPPIPPPETAPIDLFTVVWPHIEQALTVAHTDRQVAERFQLELKQAQTWLQRAVALGLIRKLSKPVRYLVATSPDQPLPLFGHRS